MKRQNSSEAYVMKYQATKEYRGVYMLIQPRVISFMPRPLSPTFGTHWK
jgi:hypothetical protein